MSSRCLAVNSTARRPVLRHRAPVRRRARSLVDCWRLRPPRSTSFSRLVACICAWRLSRTVAQGPIGAHRPTPCGTDRWGSSWRLGQLWRHPAV